MVIILHKEPNSGLSRKDMKWYNMHMQKTSNYFFSADIIRTVAIILVVLIHVFSEFLNYPKALNTPDWWIADVLNSGARIAVPLFIMLSGMLLLHSEKKYTFKEFFTKRLSKIGIPILAWPIIYFIWKAWFGHSQYSVYSIIRDYINLNIYYHLYYLYIIIALYFLTPIIKAAITNAPKELKQYFTGLTLLFSLVLTAASYFLQININLSTIFTVFIPFLGYYLVGDYIRHKTLSKKELYLYLVSFLVLMIATALGTRWHMSYVFDVGLGKHSVDYGKYFYDYTSITVAAMSIMAFVMLHTVSEKIKNINNSRLSAFIMSFAGTSFGIYLVHPLILAVSNKYLGTGFSQVTVPLWIMIFIKLAGVLIISYMIVWIIKKIPILKFIV